MFYILRQTISAVISLSQGLASDFYLLRKSKHWFFSPKNGCPGLQGINIISIYNLFSKGGGGGGGASIHKCFSFGADAL